MGSAILEETVNLWAELLLALLMGAVPNFMFAYGTGLSIRAKSPWPAIVFIISGFAAYAVGIYLARRANIS